MAQFLQFAHLSPTPTFHWRLNAVHSCGSLGQSETRDNLKDVMIGSENHKHWGLSSQVFKSEGPSVSRALRIFVRPILI